MLVVLYTGHGTRHPRYASRMGHELHGVAPCISFGASRPDDVIAAEVLRAVEPLAIEAAIAAMDLANSAIGRHTPAAQPTSHSVFPGRKLPTASRPGAHIF